MNGFESSLIRVNTLLKLYTKWSRNRRSMSVSIPSMRMGRLRGTAVREFLRAASIEEVSRKNQDQRETYTLNTDHLPTSASRSSKFPWVDSPHRPRHSSGSSNTKAWTHRTSFSSVDKLYSPSSIGLWLPWFAPVRAAGVYVVCRASVEHLQEPTWSNPQHRFG